MIFQHTHKKVLSGEKTQTRRIIKDVNLVVGVDGSPAATDSPYFDEGNEIEVVCTESGKQIYKVGNVYAVQPGRNQKAVGYIRITAIRRESLQAISYEDARAEGAPPDHECDCFSPVLWYANLWNHINNRKGVRWEDNPAVWVISFELVKDDAK